MSCSFSLQIPKALPCPSPQPYCRKPPLYIIVKYKPIRADKLDRKVTSISRKPEDNNDVKKFSLAVQLGALLATPAFAVTGVNNEEDLKWVLIQLAIVAFWYFLIMPPIIMNWLRVRWYRRKLFEMYLQFMFVFIFFPGILLWAPFLNFRKFPRDPSLKYPWSTPENPSQVKNAFSKYPYATPEDYD
ncbi:NAD(P)H-quinone oxidoreductase subunit L, chloroplastic isoform X2 [Hevea brasiliensis]|uniref:NAD(P)H-quinone oxidoreductase subunit L, chloroplastic isoform X2 n=1 Tax=Hevea brasiliensis TaxID=3981 RepID=UPI0025DADDDD|nr:NAD(P)H-quinone oxidoreductase subunit L, chloroplastic isoform X2 [Hevea brasiliensis]